MIALTSLDLELAKAVHKLVKDLIGIKKGDEVLIYSDTEGDWRVVEETAKAVHSIGGKVAMMRYPTPRGVGKAADPDIPRPLTVAMSNCDILIEYANKYLLYSTPWIEAMKTHRVRYICLCGMTAEMIVRCVGRVDIPTLIEFQERIAELTRNAKHMKITTPAGMEVEFENDPNRPVFSEGIVTDKPGEYMLIGQVDWAPIEESINGVIVFDGSVWPPEELGLLTNPIRLTVKDGEVTKIEGGHEAVVFKKWLSSFQDPNMFRIAHISYGCNPGAKLSGFILEDERVWGSVEWGLGHQAESFKGKLGKAKSHTDGICLNASIWMDGEQIAKEGSFTHPELAELSKKLKPSD